ncbi:PhoH family protein [Corynebacterium lubricantis]|uniref:PhoH family protein n=1 Tax=Corynebacterium lubricantis TaxID=541095 RepID=UPI0003659D3C|nr:PhoH family protein [Corynebacterium lubricantis]
MESSPEVISHTVDVDSAYAHTIFGVSDENLKVLSNLLGIDVFARGTRVSLTGPAHKVSQGTKVIGELESMARRGVVVSKDAVTQAVQIMEQHSPESVSDILGSEIISRRGKVVRPKTLGQKEYVDAIDENTIVFGIGPVGSGKTYLAVAKAVQALQSKEVKRIILTRPAVEAGEKLGFLPGTLNDKIDPYLRPLYDALRDMLDPEMIPKLMEAGIIEVAPLAYMRGRTLNDAFVILDEAQNTTPAQMKMFLTRLGFGAKMVVTGDISQVDLPRGQISGLRLVRHILRGVEDVHFSELGSSDVVRHALVGRIVNAYDEFDAKQEEKRAAQREEEEK